MSVDHACHVRHPARDSYMHPAGTRDEDCPIWDHVVQLFVCCEEDGSMAHCDKCDATVWLAHAQHGETGFPCTPHSSKAILEAAAAVQRVRVHLHALQAGTLAHCMLHAPFRSIPFWLGPLQWGHQLCRSSSLEDRQSPCYISIFADAEGQRWTEEWRGRQAAGLQRHADEEPCGRELGRWITPFRRVKRRAACFRGYELQPGDPVPG